MIAVQVQHFLRRGRDFTRGMSLLKDETGYGFSAALLAIHGSIAYSDALRTGLGSGNLASDDHGSAYSELKDLLQQRRYQKLTGLEQLRRVLGYKHTVAYASESGGIDFGLVVRHAERFGTWAEIAGTELLLEGWRDDRT